MIPAPSITMRRLVREAAMSTEPNAQPPEAGPLQQAAVTSAVDEHRRVWQSNDLLGEDPEALIMHRGQVYRLRCTKQGKLILYK